MKHLTEEEWIEFYYGESPDRQLMQEHIDECAQCAAMGRDLAHDLTNLSAKRWSEGEPQRRSEYGEQVWHTLRPSLTPYPMKRDVWRYWGWPLKWNLRVGL